LAVFIGFSPDRPMRNDHFYQILHRVCAIPFSSTKVDPENKMKMAALQLILEAAKELTPTKNPIGGDFLQQLASVLHQCTMVDSLSESLDPVILSVITSGLHWLEDPIIETLAKEWLPQVIPRAVSAARDAVVGFLTNRLASAIETFNLALRNASGIPRESAIASSSIKLNSSTSEMLQIVKASLWLHPILEANSRQQFAKDTKALVAALVALVTENQQTLQGVPNAADLISLAAQLLKIVDIV